MSDFEESPVAEGADASAVKFPWPTAPLPVQYSAHGLTPEEIKDVIAEIRSLTSKPFAMNPRLSMYH
jgi:hypothetical protein